MQINLNNKTEKELLEIQNVIQDILMNRYYLYKYGTIEAREINEIIQKDYL